MNKIKLTLDTMTDEDMIALSEWILTTKQLTKGPETVAFEEEFSKYIGAKYSVYCNSGSSAILLMLYALQASFKLKNKKVALSACSWATDLSSVIQLGLEPILVDINLQNLSVSLEDLERVFIQEAPAVLLFVTILGITPEVDKVKTLCEKYGVFFLGDHCESLGSEFNNKKLGTFELMSCYSFFFAHHIHTIEGGMVVTDDFELYETLKAIRSHGWNRDMSEETKIKWREKWNISEFNDQFTFYLPGFNLRSTDLQAFIGRRQLTKLDNICNVRNKNYISYKKYLKCDWKPQEANNSFVSNFAFPIIHENRDTIVKDLTQYCEARPLVAGNLGEHPVFIERYGKKEPPNASYIHKNGFYIPNNHKITEDEIKFVCNIINKHV